MRSNLISVAESKLTITTIEHHVSFKGDISEGSESPGSAVFQKRRDLDNEAALRTLSTDSPCLGEGKDTQSLQESQATQVDIGSDPQNQGISIHLPRHRS